ncbi:acyltransferase family protein [Pseudomonas sp. JBR1]|uniref:acyltransferase family protein n=1 Tax=Pseudomonas sp. JBR1 TaxID=3020907 RepID=UPI0023054F13|nr:acyltransferase [Pseudomonas sp. JBR1]WCE07647.1 acyltransferase [Pseudomonas sp. JBR1]
MTKTTPEKDLRIETIRGLALFLMVAGHVIGSSSTLGLKVPDESVLRYLYDSLVYVRMPLFTAISGYVYALRPVNTGSDLSRFYQGKFKRIGIPLLVVSTLFFALQMAVPNTNYKPQLTDIFSIYFFSYAHFWFLQSIFCVFVVIALLEKAGLLLTLRNFGLVFAVALAASFAWESFPDLFSLYKAVQLFPFFLLGLGLYRFSEQLITRRNIMTMTVALVILVAIDQAYLFELVDLDEGDMAVVGTALGLAAISLLIARRFYFKPLAWLGYFSFEIYLFHVFGTAGARIVLNKLQVHDIWVVFTVSMILGLFLPVALKVVLERISPLHFLSVAFFGAKTRVNRATPPLQKKATA